MFLIEFSRRMVLRTLTAGAGLLGFRKSSALLAGEPNSEPHPDLVTDWHRLPDRVWLGPTVWANPMENWCVKDGAAECLTMGGNRNIHLITKRIDKPQGSFAMSVDVQRVEQKQVDGGAGFRIGVHAEIDDHRADVFARNGLDAGLLGDTLTLAGKQEKIPTGKPEGTVTLRLEGKCGEKCDLYLSVADDDKILHEMRVTVPNERVRGNVALVNTFAARPNRNAGARYRFSNWTASGEAFATHADRAFGPILWSMYSLSDSRSDDGYVLRLSGLTGPMGEPDDKTLRLELLEPAPTTQVDRQVKQWREAATAELDTDAWTGIFEIKQWDASRVTPYRVRFRQQYTDGTEEWFSWEGSIKASPEDRPLRLGALTCQNDYAFPYEPVVKNVIALDPDMLYFSGDQIYEGHGGYGIIREPAEPAILNYLRKFYQFGWAFRDAMKDRPTLCIPDDHDVFQGNIWGEGGAKMVGLDKGASSKGGYRQPARMVNAVHRSCVGHHPAPYDPSPSKQNISVYYGTCVFGNVSFAVLGDRQWKSGPERVETGSGRADHVSDPDFDTSVLDKPGLELLGTRQEKFLADWAKDWDGHTMKVLLSQTVFAGVATHHGGPNGYLKADLDSGGWPQTARDRTIDILRDSKALHICGDQHLATISQYGVDEQRDANWVYCTPAIGAGYPRWWLPDDLGMEHENRPEHGLPNTGEFVDGLGNKVYVYAVGNPEVGKNPNRYEKAHEKASGFGIVTIDTVAKTYTCDAFRFLIDATTNVQENQFPGWPITIHQAENGGENRIS